MSFFIVKVTAPKDVTLVATGREVDRTQTNQVQTVVYASGPARDFYLAASANYVINSVRSGEVTIRFYAPKSLQTGAKTGLDIAVRAMEDYSAHYAPYPYTELALVATPTQALGIEYPGMIAIAQRIIDPNELYLEGTVAHEVGHQWFYNLVGNDQLDDPWLDESLAQYATLQYFKDEYGSAGANGFRQSLTGRWEGVENELIPIGLPVAAYHGREYGAIVYGRGPLFFEALEESIGVQTFDAFMKKYVETFAWGVATPEGLEQVAEEECKCDLTKMFEEWVYPP
jgi:aminopeptidase N